MNSKVNLAEKFAMFEQIWTPKIIGAANGQLIKIARGGEELVWHKHEHEDEIFLVLQGQLTLQMHEGDQVLEQGELFVVPKGVMHCPKAIEDTWILLIEPAGTAHTGEVLCKQTIATEQQEWI